VKKIVFFLALTCLALGSNAQAGLLFEKRYDAININNPASGLGSRSVDVDYNYISGNPFYSTKWHAAVVVLQRGNAIRLGKAKLNFYNNSLLYVDSAGQTMAADTTVINHVYFLGDKDTGRLTAMFYKVNIDDAKPPVFAQVLNQGKLVLLKATVITVKSVYNNLNGRNDYSFKTGGEYYFFKNNNALYLKHLDKESIEGIIPVSADAQQWLAAHKNKLGSEQQVVDFLNYYNNF